MAIASRSWPTLLLALFAWGKPLEAVEALAARIDEVLCRPELRTATCGVLIARLGGGEVLYEQGADKLLAPASTLKLVSSAGALAALGKDYRFETRIVAGGEVHDGLVDGDLVLVASGDPNLSQRVSNGERLLFKDKDHSYAGFYDAAVVPGDPLCVVKDLARQVAAAGVRRVRGGAVVDDGLFAETFDDFVGPLSAACVNDNLVDVFVLPGDQPGEPARCRWQPEARVVEVRSRARTVEAGGRTALWVERRPGVASFELLGTIASDATEVLRTGALEDPPLAAAHYLAEALREAGVEVEGRPRSARRGPAAYREAAVLARHVSVPLGDALRVVLKTSQNLHASMLPPLVGALRGRSSDREGGFRVMGEILGRAGLDPEAVIVGSGSGGGRADHLSARWLVGLLRIMAARDDFPVWLDALPAGGEDGTLASHFRAPEFEGRVRAKTGTLVYRGALNDRWIYVSKSLAGYLDPGDPPDPSRRVAFAIIIAGAMTRTRQNGADDLIGAQEDILRAVLAADADRAP
jgi:D-alanyl-D-alanine carboxypeptidase/D-alanyl-D-alanine-endopeptidase (penicillin-binding protein 4)